MELGELRMESSNSSVQQTSSLTPTKFITALRNENGESNISTWNDIVRAHIVLRTMLDYGFSFSDEQTGESLSENSFFFDYLYVKLSAVLQSRHERDIAHKVLNDAVQYNILSSVRRDIIYGGIEVMQETEARFKSLQDVLAEMYKSVTNRLSELEAGLGQTVEALEELKLERSREKRIAMGAAWAKLGLSLIPVAGPVAMSVAGMTGEVLLSFSPKDIVDMLSGVLGGLTDVAVQRIGPDIGDETSTVFDDSQRQGSRKMSQTEYAIRLVEVALSDSVLENMSTSDRRSLLAALRQHYGMSLEEMRQDSRDAAVKQYCLDADVHECFLMPMREQEPPVHESNGRNDGNDIENINFAERNAIDNFAQADTSLHHDSDEYAKELERNAHGDEEQIENSRMNAPDFASDTVLSDSSSEANNVLPPPGSEEVAVEAFSIGQVAELFSSFACKTISDGSAAEIRNRVRKNVKQRMIGGRGVMSSSISAKLVARTALYGNSKHVEDLDTNFCYLELVDFVEKLRRREVSLPR